MKFKDLTEKQKKKLAEIYNSKEYSWDVKEEKLAKFTGKASRTARKWCEKLGLTNPKESKSPQFDSAEKKTFNKKAKRFIITWAQMNTPIHKQFFENIKVYAEEIGAEIHVIAGKYNNPRSLKSEGEEGTWATEVMPYLDAGRHNVHQHMTIMSDYPIMPTATNPMSGLRGDTGDNSCIFGHPRVQMEMVPVLDGHAPKMMLTTGACTVNNYSRSKAGKKGEFHHTFGFAIVEIKNKDKFFTRQVTATSDGNFNDIYYNVSDGSVTRNTTIDAAVLGDIHLGQTDPAVLKETIKLFKKLKPKHTIIHDLFDGSSINHHESHDPIAQYHKEKTDGNSLKKEIDFMIKWIDRMRQYNLVIVRSNHDDFVDRWIKKIDWKQNIKNAMEYMDYTKVLLTGKAPKGIIPYIIDKHFDDVITLGRDQGFQVNGWEVGYHGDHGTGGTRGSLQQYRTLSTKTITGHSHSPGRMDGSLAVGTSTYLRMGYNQGASAWLNSHVIIHTDGKAQHLNFIVDKNGGAEFTTFK